MIAHHEPVAAREVGRLAELPVPIVAAVCKRAAQARGGGLGPAGAAHAGWARAGLALPARRAPAGQRGVPGLRVGTGVAVPPGLAGARR